MSLGIYFSPKSIIIVETKSKNIVNNIQIPNSQFLITGSEAKVPEEVKMAAVLNENLRKNKIEGKEAAVALSSKDLIIRTFAIPVLPFNELTSAINFEAKKYIPFKIEELVSNYQVKLDRVSRRYYVLFVGIKKEIIEKYLSILQQLNIKVNAIEYSVFSILRLIDLSGFKEKGVIGVINIDAEERDEAAFTVIENGFPLFSCDIKLFSSAQEAGKILKDDGMASEKLKTEIRISLDYYNHKFPGKKIKRMLLIGCSDYSASIEAFVQELGLAFKFVNLSNKIVGKAAPLSFLKGYSISLYNVVKTAIRVDILLSWERSKQGKNITGNPLKMVLSLFSGVNFNPYVLILAVLICIGSFTFGLMQKIPLQQDLNVLALVRPKNSNVNPQASCEELQGIEAENRGKIMALDTILKKQLYLTPQLASISVILPEGLWLEGFSFVNNEGIPDFSLNGMAYLSDNSKELEAINNFFVLLKEDPVFNQYFADVKVVSADIANVEDKAVTKFVITGKGRQGGAK